MIMSVWLNSSLPNHGQNNYGESPFQYHSSVKHNLPNFLAQLMSDRKLSENGTTTTEYYDNYVDGGGSEGAEFILGELTTSDIRFALSVTTENYAGSDFVGNNTGDGDEFWMFFQEKYLRHSLGWTITLILGYLIILISGFFGNLFVILVVIFRPHMRNITNLFITNLAISDFLVVLFCIPPTLISNVLIRVSVAASAYSLVAISLDRSKAIYRPLERPRGLSKSQALITICLIWILAIIMTLPWAAVFDVIKSDKDGLTYCVETWRNEQHGKVYFLVANLIFCYSLPLVLITISNIVIWCHVSRRKVPQETTSAGTMTIKRMHAKAKKGVRKMLGIVTITFLLSWLPLYILATRVKFSSSDSIGETEANLLSILIPFAQWLGSSNSSVNFCLYAFLNSKFRDSFKSLLPSWFPFIKRKPRTTLVTNGTIVGTTASPSYTTVYTARSSGRSSGNSRRFHYSKNYQAKTLLVSNIRSNMTTTTTTQLPHPPPSPNFPTITDL